MEERFTEVQGKEISHTWQNSSHRWIIMLSLVSHDLFLKGQPPTCVTQTKPCQRDWTNISDHLHNLSCGNYLDWLHPDAIWLLGSWNRLLAFDCFSLTDPGCVHVEQRNNFFPLKWFTKTVTLHFCRFILKGFGRILFVSGERKRTILPQFSLPRLMGSDSLEAGWKGDSRDSSVANEKENDIYWTPAMFQAQF